MGGIGYKGYRVQGLQGRRGTRYKGYRLQGEKSSSGTGQAGTGTGHRG